MNEEDIKKQLLAISSRATFLHSELLRMMARQYATEIILTGYLGTIPTVDRDLVMKELDEQAKIYHEKLLLLFEQKDPALAALLDRRSASEIPDME